MPRTDALSASEIEQLDRFYRAEGLRQMASPHVHYDDPQCPHPDCSHKMGWIDFKLERYGDPEGVYKPSWWEGTGFAGRCPSCQRWIRFITLCIEAIDEQMARQIPQLPDQWHTVAQFA